MIDNNLNFNDLIWIIEKFPCNNKFELRREEGKNQRIYEPLCNKQIAGRTKEEYNEDNKKKFQNYQKKWRENNYEKRIEYFKNYYKKNKEIEKIKRKEIIICSCGLKSTKYNLKRHQQTKKHILLIQMKTNGLA